MRVTKWHQPAVKYDFVRAEFHQTQQQRQLNESQFKVSDNNSNSKVARCSSSEGHKLI